MIKKKKILVSGGMGSFPRCLYEAADKNKYDIILLSRSDMDVTNRKEISDSLERYLPDYFIHSAALTRPMSVHEKFPGKSILNNIIGTSNVTIECMKKNIKLVYISTDHVYEGKNGNYSECDPVNPVNNYAWSKLGGECAVKLYNNSCILRIAMVCKPFPHKFAIVDSKKSSIYIDEAAKICIELIDSQGVYNVGGESMSIYDFAKLENNDTKEIFLRDIQGVKMPKDVSMNLEKMKRELKK